MEEYSYVINLVLSNRDWVGWARGHPKTCLATCMIASVPEVNGMAISVDRSSWQVIALVLLVKGPQDDGLFPYPPFI